MDYTRIIPPLISSVCFSAYTIITYDHRNYIFFCRFSLALYCHSLNMTVISACHNVTSKGAVMLQHLNDPKRMIIIELDLLKPETITNAYHCLTDLLTKHNDYHFTALVNNAGVMCFGEFEWQTWSQIEMQINVNLLGSMRLTKELIPLVRQHRARIINVTSHCGLQVRSYFWYIHIYSFAYVYMYVHVLILFVSLKKKFYLLNILLNEGSTSFISLCSFKSRFTILDRFFKDRNETVWSASG